MTTPELVHTHTRTKKKDTKAINQARKESQTPTANKVNIANPGDKLVLMYGRVLRPALTALRANKPAPSMTEGLLVFVHDVIAAMTTSPCFSLNCFSSKEKSTDKQDDKGSNEYEKQKETNRIINCQSLTFLVLSVGRDGEPFESKAVSEALLVNR